MNLTFKLLHVKEIMDEGDFYLIKLGNDVQFRANKDLWKLVDAENIENRKRFL